MRKLLNPYSQQRRKLEHKSENFITLKLSDVKTTWLYHYNPEVIRCKNYLAISLQQSSVLIITVVFPLNYDFIRKEIIN